MTGLASAKVLVTGGTGFLGSFLLEQLLKKKCDVMVFDNNWRGKAENLAGLDVQFVEGDIRDAAAVEKAMVGAEYVFHLASVQGTKNFYRYPELSLEVGLLGNLNVAKAAAKVRPKRLFFSSSSEVYAQPTVFPTPETHPLVVPDPANPRWSYSLTKIAGEVIFNNVSHQHGFESVAVRIHNAYGPRMGWDHVIPEFIRRLVLNEPFTIQGSGKETRSFCYVDDIIAGFLLVMEKGQSGGVYNIGNEQEEHTILDVVRLLSDLTGKKITPQHLPVPEGSTSRRLPDLRNIRALGYNPTVALREGLEKTLSWYGKKIQECLQSGVRPWEK